MKKLILVPILLLTLFAFSQNGGQTNEDQYLKIEYIGNLTGKITNKQLCTIDIKITIDGGSQTTVTLPSLGTYTFPVVLNTRVIAKPLSNCAGTNENMGQVELKFTQTVLPVKFTNFSVKNIGNNTMQVLFEVAEVTNVHHYNVQLSRDGHTWQTVGLIFPDALQPNKIYSAKVTLSK